MSSFYGTYGSSVDDRGRILVPKRLREGNGSEDKTKYLVTRGYDGCLSLFPLDEWEPFERGVRGLSFRDADARSYQRETGPNTYPTKIDRLGRVLIPKELVEDFEIGKEVMLLGVFDHIEVWNKAAHEAYRRSQKGRYEEVAEKFPVDHPPGGSRDQGARSGSA
jgi:MraZ protein